MHMNQSTYPSITCLCLTRNRPHFLKRSIDCFLSQTYPNKELLILVRDDDQASMEVVKSFDQKNISCLLVDTKGEKSLGELRNFAIENCPGEYFCQWDDDDWYHNSRLQLQIEALLQHGKTAGALVKMIMFNVINEQAYISSIGPWASSIICKKSLITEQLRYPHLPLQEDSIFLNRLFGANCLLPLLAPWTYIYVYHGNNTWHSRHFNMLFAMAKKLPQPISHLVGEILHGNIDNETASSLLSQPDILKEMDYFYFPPLSKRALWTNLWRNNVFFTKEIFKSFGRIFQK
jgi:glycosyltransferase involved in cell wall biosynthesis